MAQVERTRSRWLHHLWRYSLPLLLFGGVLGLSQILTNINFKLNLTIPIVFAVVATAWWGGRGPGIVLAVLFEGATILYAVRPPELDLAWHFVGAQAPEQAELPDEM